jgi:predicted lipoprotein with Yx(FWY)xxD motif
MMNEQHRTRHGWRRIGLGLLLLTAVSIMPQGLAQAQSAPTVGTRDAPALGTILTDAAGMTLYTFKPDTAGVSTCYDQCAAAWPPALAQGDVVSPDGLDGALATSGRRDGSQQLTFNGMPLYRYAADQGPDDTNGQGVGNVWFVVNPALAAAADSTAVQASDQTAPAAAAPQAAPAPKKLASAAPAPIRGYSPGW